MTVTCTFLTLATGMPVWLPFRQAKAAFLVALSDRHQSLPTHAFPSPQRRAVRTEVDALISSLEELDDELKDIQREIHQVRNSIFQRKAAAITSLQPIAMLPHEIIREIVVHTIEGPWAYRQIMHLSQVSNLWRDVVLSISALFTRANWDRWPFELVDAWCSRAGSHLLTIQMGGNSLRRMDDVSGDPYRALLNKFAVQIGRLELLCEGMSRAASRVLSLRMPSLHHLSISRAHPVMESENFPMLRALLLILSKPVIATPLHATRLHYFFVDLRDDGVHILSQLPHLQHLKFTIAGEDIQWATEQHIVLPSLISLEVTWVNRADVNGILFVLNLLSLPELQTIVLHNNYKRDGYITLFHSLVWARYQKI